jgi:hypothetical protein
MATNPQSDSAKRIAYEMALFIKEAEHTDKTDHPLWKSDECRASFFALYNECLAATAENKTM